MSTLSIVIPAYNEENGIAEIMQRILNVRENLEKIGIGSLELLIVDDGSHDKTADIARTFTVDNPQVIVISHLKNKGYGGALKTGFAQASGEYIGFMDADGTYPPEYYPALCQSILDGAELVIGSRMAGSESQMPKTRRLGNFIFANLLKSARLAADFR